MKYTKCLLFAIVPLLVLTLVGCTSLSKCPPNDTACLEVERAKQVGLWAADLRDIAGLGAAVYLEEHPESRLALTKTVEALKVLESSERFGIDEILTIIRSAGVDKFESSKGQLYVTAGRIILRRASGEVGVKNPAEARQLAAAIRLGIESAL